MIDPEAMEVYRATERRRLAERRARLNLRRERAWQAARRAGELLRSQFGASRVVVFGSLAREEVDERSDIDLAAWAISDAEYFRALSAVQGLDTEFSVDLVQAETARPSLLAVIADGRDV